MFLLTVTVGAYDFFKFSHHYDVGIFIPTLQTREFKHIEVYAIIEQVGS